MTFVVLSSSWGVKGFDVLMTVVITICLLFGLGPFTKTLPFIFPQSLVYQASNSIITQEYCHG